MTPQTLPDRLLAAKFRKRPLVIEAIQYIFDGTTRFADEAQDDIADFMGQNIVVVGDNIEIQTPEGPIYASPGDWIIRGVAGEFYPCKPDIFTATYEAEAAAALSAPEGDMARALEWLRGFGWVVPDTVKSAIEEAIVAYDPARAGAYSGVKSGRVAVAEVYEGAFGIHYIACADPNKLPVGTKLYTTPQPADGWRPIAEAPRDDGELLAFTITGNVRVEHTASIAALKAAAVRDADQCFYSHWMPLPAAPSAKGVAK